MSEFQLTIDCPPGPTRPDSIATQVLNGTGIFLDDPVSKSFGSWTWDIPEKYSKSYRENQVLIGKRLKTLFQSGAIRYAEW